MTYTYPFEIDVVYSNDIEYQNCIANIIKDYTEWHSIIDILYDLINKKKESFLLLFEQMKKRHILGSSDRNCILLLMSYDYFLEFHKCVQCLYANNTVDFITNYTILLKKSQRNT
jgi:hypothetical protein